MCADGVRYRWHLTIPEQRRHTHYDDDDDDYDDGGDGDDNRLSSVDVLSPILVRFPYIQTENTEVYFYILW